MGLDSLLLRSGNGRVPVLFRSVGILTGVRNLDLVRELDPELQPLDTWLTQHKNEIPLD